MSAEARAAAIAALADDNENDEDARSSYGGAPEEDETDRMVRLFTHFSLKGREDKGM